MADPQNKAESKPPIAPGSDAQASMSVNRTPPSSNNAPSSDLQKVLESASNFSEKLEELAKSSEAMSEQNKKRLEEIQKQRKHYEDTLKTADEIASTLGESLEFSEEISNVRKSLEAYNDEIEEMNKKEKEIANEITDTNKNLSDAIETLVEGFVGFGEAIEGNKEVVEKLTNMQSDLNKVNKADLKNATELLKINERRKSVDAAKLKLDSVDGFGQKSLSVFKGVNQGIEKLITVASLSKEDQKKSFEKMMADEKERAKVTDVISESIRSQLESNQKTIDDLEEKKRKASISEQIKMKAEIESLKKEIRKSESVLVEIQKGGDEATAVIEKLVGVQLEMSDRQRKEQIRAMERAAELDAQGIPPELMRLADSVETMKGLLKDIGIGQKGGLLKLIFLFLSATLGAWISAMVARVMVLVNLVRNIPIILMRVGKLITNLGTWFSRFGGRLGQIGNFLMGFGRRIREIAVYARSIFSAIRGFFKPAVDLLKLIGSLFGKTFRLFSGVTRIFGGGGGGFLALLAKAFRIGFNAIKAIPFIGTIISIIMGIFDVIKVFKALGDSKDSIVTKLLKGIVVALINFLTLGFLDFNKVLNFVNKMFSSIGNVFGKTVDMFKGLYNIFVGMFEGLADWTWGWIETLANWFDSMKEKVSNFVMGIPNMLQELFGKISDWLWSWIETAFTTIKNGLANMPIIGRFFRGGGGKEEEKGILSTVFGGVKDNLTKNFITPFKGIFDIIKGKVNELLEPFDSLMFKLESFGTIVEVIAGQVNSSVIGLFNKLADSAIGKFLGLKPISEGEISNQSKSTTVSNGFGFSPQDISDSAKMSASDYSQYKSEEGVSDLDYGSIYTALSNLLQTGDALMLDDNALSLAMRDAMKAHNMGKNNKSMEPQLRKLKESYFQIYEDRMKQKKLKKVDDIEKSRTASVNVVGQAGAEMTNAKYAKDAAQVQAASKPVVANNTTVMNRSSNTTQVTSAPSRYNAEPTIRGTQMGALPGMV